MIAELTVRENIEHSARVRLPRSGWTNAAINAHVDAVIEVLGLTSCAHTPSCRVSGGQRKRTNIGMELAAAPSALFLGERLRFNCVCEHINTCVCDAMGPFRCVA